MYQLLKSLILPPGILLLVGATGFFLWHRKPRLSRWLVGLTLAVFYLLSTKIVADSLAATVSYPVVDPETDKAQAIVILAGSLSEFAPEYGGATVNEFTLVRLRYGARLHRVTSLPVLVSGGASKHDSPPEAQLMRETLEEDFETPVTWIEDTSLNTWQNARNSSAILKENGITSILLVTHAFHMRRAVACFEKMGMTVYAAPTGYYPPPRFEWGALLPNSQYFHQSKYALYSAFGQVKYAFLKNG